MKRAVAVAAVLVFLIVFSAFALAAENLVPNGGFETLSSADVPEGWLGSAYRNQAGYSRMTVTNEKAHSGSYSALIENTSSNDARFITTVSVEPESLYRLSGYVLVEHMEDTGNGANLAVEGIYSFSDGLFDTTGNWAYLEWYGETGEEQDELTFGVRVGGYSAESVGKAYFDDIVLEKVDALPEGIIASLWYNTAPESKGASQTETVKNTALWLLTAVIFGVGALLIYQRISVHNSCKDMFLFCSLLLSGLILRIVLGLNVPGYEVDINCFASWSMRMASIGPAGFYSPDYFCDYPPAAMLLLWPVGILLQTIGYGHSFSLLVLKSLPILCDLGGAVFLFTYARKLNKGTMGCFLAALYLFNPAVLTNGSAWGQLDSVLALLVLLTAFAAMEAKWHIALPLFVVSLLVKPQAILFAPIGGIWLFFTLFSECSKTKRLNQFKAIGSGLVFSVCAALLIIVPFSIRQDNPLTWLIDLYSSTIGSYAYATLNTANLLYLFGANWVGLDNTVPFSLSICTVILFAVAGAGMLFPATRSYLCPSEKKARLFGGLFVLFAGIHFILLLLGANYAWYGYAMMAFAYLFAILAMKVDRNVGALPFYMAVALISIYVLGIKVHERYLFPAILLLLTSYLVCGDRRILRIAVGFSAVTFVNTAIVLENSILFGAAQGHLNSDTLALNNLLSVCNLALLGSTFRVSLTGVKSSSACSCSRVFVESVPSLSYQKMLLDPRDACVHLKLRDYLLMGLTTLFYAVLAFANLGSTVAPQTAWISTSPEEEVVLDLGISQEFSVLYYTGVSYRDFAISVSEDGVHWKEPAYCKVAEGQCYKWMYVRSFSIGTNGEVHYQSEHPSNTLHFAGRYLKVHALESGLNLWEIVARNNAGENIPLSLVSHTGANPSVLKNAAPANNLIDESNTCVGEPGWYNSTYFDEIYHAREAYHNLHGESRYEWTHPPLGKLLMAASIAVFGMTPFGWRFAGAFVGVLMLPALYLLGMQLTKKRSFAVVSMIAFALDLMHFTQTRIATIDSFPLLFILLSYLCMIRYMQTDLLALPNGEKPKLMTNACWKSMLPLALSGLFMGLSIACKWTGVYSALGLALLFFLTIYRQYRVSQLAWETELDNQPVKIQNRITAARNYTLHRILITCGFCVLFFVAVPLAIYVLSYIPQLAPDGPVTLTRIIQTQEDMLAYHATPGLGSDHPFQSPWWQWPLIMKPIWYVQDQYEPVGYASTIMCLGNPWVFYIGAFAMLGVIGAFIWKYFRIQNGKLVLRKGDGDITLLILIIAFCAQYLPWVLVPRSMYIYHYFASVPFIILATAWWIEQIKCFRVRRWVIALYLVGAAVFFVLFFPYASGVLTDIDWLNSLKWFSKLYY